MCFSLANLCEYKDAYATRMFDSGLFSIMTELVSSSHPSICDQAVRCMESMIHTINKSPDKQVMYTTQKKVSIFYEALAALSSVHTIHTIHTIHTPLHTLALYTPSFRC